MVKKLMAILMSIAMLASVVCTSAFAEETAELIQDFSGELVSGQELMSVEKAMGIGGKSADDVSIKTTNQSSDKSRYRIVSHRLYGRTTISYNLLFNTSSVWSDQLYMNSNGSYNKMCYLGKNGSYVDIRNGGNTISKAVGLGTWHNVTFDMNLTSLDESDMPARTYKQYVDGVLLYTGTVPEKITDGGYVDFRFAAAPYIDDIKITSGGYTPAAQPTVESGAVTVNSTNKTITMSSVPASCLANGFTVTNGTFLGVVDSTTYLTKTTENVLSGDQVAFQASDGNIYYYKIIIANPTAAYSQNFTALNSSVEYTTKASLVPGIGGKASDDKSVFTESHNDEKSSYRKSSHQINGRTTISYNLLFDMADGLWANQFRITNGSWPVLCYISVNTNTLVNIENGSRTARKTVPLGRWYNVAFDINPTLADADDGLKARTYIMYVNGEAIYTGEVPSVMKEGTAIGIRLGAAHYLDDFKIYSGAYKHGTDVALASTDLKVDNDTKSVPYANLTGTEYVAKFTATGGTVTGVYNSADTAYATKTTQNVEVGDLLAVTSDDGIITYYTVVDSASITSVGSYTLDETAKTISGIFKNTSVEAFKSKIVCLDESIVKVVKKNGAEVTSGTIENGMTLTVGTNTYTLSTLASYLKEDFDDATADVKFCGTYNPSTVANGAGVDLDYTAFSDDGVLSYAKVTDTEADGKIMEVYTNDTTSRFIGYNEKTGLKSGANVLEFSINKQDKTAATKVWFRGTTEKETSGYDNIIDEGGHPLVAFETDSSVYFLGEQVCGYNLNEWYRVSVITDIDNNVITLYFDGRKIGEKKLSDPITRIWYLRFESYQSPRTASVYYLDDIDWYACDNSVEFYDEEKTVELTSTSDSVAILPKAGICYIDIIADGMTVGDVVSALESTGSISAPFTSDGTEITDLTKLAASGMYVNVTSPDGYATRKYTFAKDGVTVTFTKDGEVVDTTVNGNIKATVTITTDDAAESYSAKFVAAVYEGNKLVDVDVANVGFTLANGNYVIRSFDADVTVDNAADQTIKAFLIKSLDSVAPMGDTFELGKPVF